MSQSLPLDASKRSARRPSRIRWPLVLLVFVITGLICAAGWFSDDLGYFFTLKLWAPNAPAQVVTGFLEAGRTLDEAKAGQYVSKYVMPFQKNGKLAGYYVHDPHFNHNTYYYFSKIEPSNPNVTPQVQMVLRGDGGALVTVPDHNGRPEVFRMVMINGSWKIDEVQ